jgi:hypothetical protein
MLYWMLTSAARALGACPHLLDPVATQQTQQVAGRPSCRVVRLRDGVGRYRITASH